MALDYRMYQGNPLRSIEDYRGDILKNQAGEQAIQGNALKLQEAVRAQQMRDQFNALIAAGADPSTPEGQRRLSAVDPFGTGKLALEYANVGEKKATEKLNLTKADQEKVDTKIKQFNFHFQQLGGIDPSDPKSVASWLMAGKQNGLFDDGDLQQAAGIYEKLATQPDGPQKFQQLLLRKAMDPKSQEELRLRAIDEARKAQADAVTAANQDMILVDGEWVPNRPLLDEKLKRSAVGATRVTNAIQAFEPFEKRLQGEMAKTLVEAYDKLRNIPTSIQALDKAKEYAKNNSFVGSLAEQKLNIVKFFNNNLGTNILPNDVKNVEALRSALFQNVMDNLRSLDAQPSQQQQQALQDSLGRITTDPKALEEIIDLWKGQLQSKAREHNRRVKETAQKGVPYAYDISIPIDERKAVRPTVGEVVDGYRFKGGEPSDKNSWEKVK